MEGRDGLDPGTVPLSLRFVVSHVIAVTEEVGQVSVIAS
jgi:hypothetical protein